ncbi:MAG: mechanosensitive ion channel family protein, partial [Chloroflexi bacterium]|nr:mechanosensitive ion channel family protein [Chloroflexota bacterium]
GSISQSFSPSSTCESGRLNTAQRALMHMSEQAIQSFIVWWLTHGVRIFFIAVATLVLYRGIQLAMARIERRMQATLTQRRHVYTLLRVFHSSAVVTILSIAGLMLLSELGVDIAPLIAGAGVVGLAIGLGAQTLVRDWLGGLFILFEDQFQVGDTIAVASVSGTVENITLRATYLRDGDGTLHIVPNGEMRIVSNRTSGYSRAIVDVSVRADQDINRVLQALEDVARAANADDAIKPNLTEPLQVLGVETLGVDRTAVRVSGKTLAGKQWDVSRALRRLIKEHFDAERIALSDAPDANKDGA